MKFYQMLDHKFNSDLRVAHFKNQNEAATLHVYDRELSDYSKIIPKLRASDWKQFETHFDEKSLGWKYRLACCLQFADIKWALPIWLKLFDTGNSKIQEVIRSDLETRNSKGSLSQLTKEEERFTSLVLQGLIQSQNAHPEKATAEPPERFRNVVYNQKNLKLELLLWRWKKGRSTHICCYGPDKVIDQWILHLKAGVELADHFGEAHRRYTTVQPTAEQMVKIGSAFFLKSLNVIIFDGKRNPDRMSDYTIDSEKCEITINLELDAAREMTEILVKRAKMWIKPPYIGWDLLPDVLTEEVFLLPSLPDKDGDWIKAR